MDSTGPATESLCQSVAGVPRRRDTPTPGAIYCQTTNKGKIKETVLFLMNGDVGSDA